ncbi:hypothetical protein EJB05_57534, partial [Eragrostis curvula]
MDEVLAAIAETIKNLAVIYLVDITEETITRSSDQLGIEGQARVHRHVETVNRHHERLWSGEDCSTKYRY